MLSASASKLYNGIRYGARNIKNMRHGSHFPLGRTKSNKIRAFLPISRTKNAMQLSSSLVIKPNLYTSIRFARYYSSLPEHELVKLPNLSPTMEAGTIVSWEKEEGGRIEEGEVLALIETDKSTMEMETPQEGYLAKIVISAGTKNIPVNELIAVIVNEEEDVAAFTNFTGEAAAADEPAETPQLVESPLAASTVDKIVKAPQPATSATGRVFASPRARKLAMEKGIDINMVVGTGPRGRITTANIESFKIVEVVPIKAASPPPTATPPPPPSPPPPTPTKVAAPSPPKVKLAVPQPPPAAQSAIYTDIDLSSMRKTIAKRLTESKQHIPHYYLSVDVAMDELLELRKELNEEGKGHFKLSVNDFIIKASALSLVKVPQCNSQWKDTFIRQFNSVDVSVAVSTDGGLITPIIHDADKKGLVGINQAVTSLAEKARNKTIQPHEFIGGSFSISNLGMYGITNFSAVINPPQSCILAVGGTQERLIADHNSERGLKIGHVMNVTLSCDHRVVDGAIGAQWLKEFRTYLEKPMKMLL